MKRAVLAFLSLALAVAPAESRTSEEEELFARAREAADARDFEAALSIVRGLRAGSSDDYDFALFEARVLAWDDRNAASAAAFDRLAREHPDQSRSFALERARQLSWSGRDRDAERVLAAIDEVARTAEERILLARLYRWDDRPYASLAELGHVYGSRGARTSPAELASAGVERDRALRDLGIVAEREPPWFRVELGRIDDSDGFDLGHADASAGLGVNDALMLGGSVRLDAYEQGTRSIDVRRVGVLGFLRFGPGIARAHVRVGEGDGVSFSPVTADASVALRPSDRLGLSASYERTDYESIRALERKVIGQFLTLAARIHAGARRDARLGVGVGVVDGPGPVRANERLHGFAEVGRVVVVRPRLRLSLSGYAFSFSETTGDGYWNPDSYWILSAGADWNPSSSKLRTELVIAASVGVQGEDPGKTAATGSGTIRVIHHPLTGWVVEYRYARSDASLSSDTGFSRDRHVLSVSGRF